MLTWIPDTPAVQLAAHPQLRPPSDADGYVSQDDSVNGCAYPRHCVVSPMRVVREYAMRDGMGGQRRFGIRYRDGRYDPETNGVAQDVFTAPSTTYRI